MKIFIKKYLKHICISNVINTFCFILKNRNTFCFNKKIIFVFLTSTLIHFFFINNINPYLGLMLARALNNIFICNSLCFFGGIVPILNYRRSPYKQIYLIFHFCSKFYGARSFSLLWKQNSWVEFQLNLVIRNWTLATW